MEKLTSLREEGGITSIASMLRGLGRNFVIVVIDWG